LGLGHENSEGVSPGELQLFGEEVGFVVEFLQNPADPFFGVLRNVAPAVDDPVDGPDGNVGSSGDIFDCSDGRPPRVVADATKSLEIFAGLVKGLYWKMLLFFVFDGFPSSTAPGKGGRPL
jgi:hypothetical protein